MSREARDSRAVWVAEPRAASHSRRLARDLPSGTVTLLFTDIEGSTRLLHELGPDAYAEALSEHRRLLREAFARRCGVEVDTQGDAFFYAFTTAPGALEAALEAREALADGPVRVRIGIHTGTPHLTEEGYVGADVHRAARIAASGHGGQVLVSAATAALTAEPPLRDLGEHRLKDLSAPERIYQLGAGEFPPLRSLYRTNLPVPGTPFLGRGQELSEVVGLVSREEVRLVTLTGPGGTGKTRLALQAVGQAADAHPDGVWWVPLAALRDPALVLPAAAKALQATDGLAEHIGDRRTLILFDNFEHVVEAASGLAELLEACPALDLLVTSRQPLHLAAEQEYAVLPLAPAEGVSFFQSRARAVEPTFQTGDAVPEICRRLDDLPLALELAAARVKVLSPQQILERLEHRLPLLTGGTRDAPARQRTLEATIGWSYELLTEEERTLFQRLSVFAGGCTLAAAESVAGAELDTLHSLVDKSLVRRREERYWMLESIREYAADRLEESGASEQARRRHAESFLELAEAANLSLEVGGLGQRYELVSQEIDNMRVALAWSLEADPALGLSLAGALEMAWVIQDPNEGMRWFEALLAKAVDAPLYVRARALLAYGSAANPGGDDELAERVYLASLAAFRELGDDHGVAVLLLRLGYSALYRGDDVRAGELAAESLALHRATGYRPGESQSLGLAGEVAYRLGDHRAGMDLIERSADLAGEADFPWWRSRMLRKLVDCTLELGHPADAEAWARESLRLAHGTSDPTAAVFALARLARIAAELARPEQAGRLWGAIEAEEARRPMGGWAKERDRLAAPVLAHAEAEFERGRELGRALELGEAVELALASGA